MDHDNEKKYFELLALMLLKEYTKIDINNFENKEEPDWQDEKNGVGIEVTNTNEGRQFWEELEKVKKPVPDNKIKNFNKRFEKNGGRVIPQELAKIIFGENHSKDSFGFNEKYFYIIPCYNDDFSTVNKSISIKTLKLNKNYNLNIKDNRLFIFTPILVTKEMLENELTVILKKQDEFEKKFNVIYICLLSDLYIFNINKKKCEHIKMQKERVEQISIEASKIINIKG